MIPKRPKLITCEGRFLRQEPNGSLADLGESISVLPLGRRNLARFADRDVLIRDFAHAGQLQRKGGRIGAEFLIVVLGFDGYFIQFVPLRHVCRWTGFAYGQCALTLTTKGDVSTCSTPIKVPDSWQEKAERFAKGGAA